MLTVVTMTRHTRPALLERCRASVAAALPPGSTHAVVECHSNFARTRYETSQLSEFVAFVDDDDTIDHRALHLCLDALRSSGAGLACTNEVMVKIDMTVLQPMRAAKWYGGIGVHPRTAHHLSVFRRDAVDPRALELDTQFDLGIDWFIKASAALQYGAVHVPIDGYFWTCHDEQESTDPRYNVLIRDMGRAIRDTWPREDAALPIYRVE